VDQHPSTKGFLLAKIPIQRFEVETTFPLVTVVTLQTVVRQKWLDAFRPPAVISPARYNRQQQRDQESHRKASDFHTIPAVIGMEATTTNDP
jgi:hypothetical protein